MLSVRRNCPIDYRLCNQTVTVYHRDGGAYTRKVYENAFLDFKKTENVDKTGGHETNSFLLVIPGSKQTVFVGDKVQIGIGAEITTRETWSELVPTKVPGLVVVEYVDPKYWNGKIVHTEAGG